MVREADISLKRQAPGAQRDLGIDVAPKSPDQPNKSIMTVPPKRLGGSLVPVGLLLLNENFANEEYIQLAFLTHFNFS